MTLHLKSRGYPFRPRLLFSSFIVVGVGFPTVYYFRRGQGNLNSYGRCSKGFSITQQRLLHKGESLCCFRDSASVTYGGMLPSELTLSALRFILSAKSGQSYKHDCGTVDFCNRLQ